MSTPISNMTHEDLENLIESIIEKRLSQNTPKRPLAEVLDSLDRHIWTPPANGKTSLEYLREDRDA
jgi:hypothetical protein